DYLDYSFNITIDATPKERNSFGSNDTNDNPTDPGLYLSDNKLLLSWDELVNNYDLNVSNDYKNYNDDSSSKLSNIIDVIDHDYAMENQQYKLVLDSKIQKLGDYSLSYVEQLASIKLNDGLLSVGTQVFDFDDNLTEIVFPDSITSFANYPIGNLENLKYVHFPPSYDNFDETVFDGCPNIENVDMSDNYKSVDGVVYSADGSKLLLYPSGKTDTSFTIPGSVTYINDYAFEDTSNLTKVVFEDPRNWNVGGEFFSSNLLRDSSAAIEILRSEHKTDEFIKLSPGLYSYYNEQVISWDEFEKEYSVDLSFGDRLWHESTENEFGQMASILKNNSELEDVRIIVIPETVDTIGENMFYNASNVEVILLPNSLKNIEDFAFYECPNLKYLDIPDGINYISLEFCHNCSSLTEINIPKNVTNIGIDAFYGSGLKRVYFENPNGWQYNGVNLAASELSDPSKAANYLARTKHSYNWNRL
ncbi:MAG: leucine-rich repeat domain-containing protein, partial [Bacilli bacterium]|nr:leucine-rich repeat domain-containing protein [Bacilli bacterium]